MSTYIIFIMSILSLSLAAQHPIASQVPKQEMARSVPAQLAEVQISESWKDDVFSTVNPSFRFQALRFQPIQDEYGDKLYVNKYYHGGHTAPIQHHFTKEIIYMDKKLIKEFASLNQEYGDCCRITNLNWNKFDLSFKIKIKNDYLCEVKNAHKKANVKATCQKI